MPVQETSREAFSWEVLHNLGQRQRVVYDAMAKRPDFTNSELAQFLGFPINTVTPRVFELRERGLIKEVCKRECKMTGRTVIAWSIIRNQGTLF